MGPGERLVIGGARGEGEVTPADASGNLAHDQVQRERKVVVVAAAAEDCKVAEEAHGGRHLQRRGAILVANVHVVARAGLGSRHGREVRSEQRERAK